ncbi:hypothetical protein CVV72_28125 [Amycolatopsis sp. TNS106]|nr:hypothetical protein CVV72_28125 [Amycolatopsis sp. TNS106]
MRENGFPPPSFWPKVPVEPGFRSWLTNAPERQLLVVVRTLTTLNRIQDILTLTSADLRIQTTFTFDEARPGILSAGVSDALRALRVAVTPWEQATKNTFDLILAASENDALHELNGPILLVPHGIGYQKYYPGRRVTSGMDPDRLRHHDRVIPAAIALSHSVQREQLKSACPEALDRAVVVGDPCHDRMMASRHRVAAYRAALGAGDRKVVVIASTWGRHSLYARYPRLPHRLLSELPLDDFQLVLTLHPGVWAAHGPWQLESWLRPELAAGLTLIPPDHGWQAALLAADCVLSDQGSAALYAAAAGKPVLLAPSAATTTVDDSPLAMLTRAAAEVADTGLREQIDAAIENHSPERYRPIVGQAVEAAASGQRLGDVLYDLLDLRRPDPRPAFPPVPDPAPVAHPVAALAAGFDETGKLVRFPASTRPEGLRRRHVLAHADQATLRDLDGAAIVFAEDPDRFDELLTQWPLARLVAAPAPGGCLARVRDSGDFLLSAEIDPTLLASHLHLLLASQADVEGTHTVSGRPVTVSRC